MSRDPMKTLQAFTVRCGKDITVAKTEHLRCVPPLFILK